MICRQLIERLTGNLFIGDRIRAFRPVYSRLIKGFGNIGLSHGHWYSRAGVRGRGFIVRRKFELDTPVRAAGTTM